MNQLLDILVVGGGVAGTLISEQLVKSLPSKSISLLNRERVVGGRVLTYQGEFGHQLELGAMRIPETNNRTISLCTRLGLSLDKFEGGTSSCNNFIIHNANSIESDITYPLLISNSIKSFCGFNIEDEVPADWLFLKMSMKLNSLGASFDDLSFKRWVKLVMKPEDRSLFWSLVGYDYLRQADVSAITCLKQAAIHDECNTQFFNIAGGMQRLVLSLLSNFLRYGGNYYCNQTVTRVIPHESHFTVITERESVFYCKQLVLAIPPREISSIHQNHPFLNKQHLLSIEAIGGYGSTKTYALLPHLDGISENQKSAGFFRTNLSIRQGHWNPCNNSSLHSTHQMILAEYKNEIRRSSSGFPIPVQQEWQRISSDLSKICKSTIATPIELVAFNWNLEQSGVAAHYWNKNCNYKSILREHFKVNNRLYLIGEAFSNYQGWVEGAIESADQALYRICANHLNS